MNKVLQEWFGKELRVKWRFDRLKNRESYAEFDRKKVLLMGGGWSDMTKSFMDTGLRFQTSVYTPNGEAEGVRKSKRARRDTFLYFAAVLL